ncbi:hypothetical protein C5167_042577 [Papaver somniferum]|uniref:Uncharacterized protein n=1 Tax=Papaver somniferum TaxID=3469 RepID=A0A4Y7L4X2_PAPSO|nr:hypothetical protein C5167_042577 [Papaver somniferum]
MLKLRARGLKKHFKRLNALKHSMLVKLGGSIQCVKILVIQTPLFVSGINTFLQVLFGTRLPAVIGGSFADIVPIICIIGDSSLQRITEPHEEVACEPRKQHIDALLDIICEVLS